LLASFIYDLLKLAAAIPLAEIIAEKLL